MEAPEVIKDLLEMSVDSFDEMVGVWRKQKCAPCPRFFFCNYQPHEDTPRSLLPECSWNKGDGCWDKVATDRGVCFTNYFKAGKSISSANFGRAK